ncbi:glycoside hydrolase, family 16 [Xylaria bambusicola]|uniref:glycoside hydrolase, family 16 n=1 Tax=Xylaria bambusicola TaxID=326684 RepID=UPI002008B619|nr:glycoside hydrolase, family 16 [Xylaria bambusicola]KAI0526626.1 glycoside hydrolase, family 16 [Xylaria bambusicola]
MKLRLSVQALVASSRVFAVLSLLFGSVTGDCECGYSMTTSSDNVQHVFTDLHETDFIHIDITGDGKGDASHGWAPQGYNISSQVSRGPFGESFAVRNVMSNTIKNPKIFDGPGTLGLDAGLLLLVRNVMQDDRVPVSEVSTTGLDYFYGTFRAGIKTTDVPGTCSAFFWYQNDTQEIDIEFLSAQFDKEKGLFPVNFVLQSKEAAAAGYDAANTTGLRRVNLPFDPSTDFHEYRFDFLPGKVFFYADGNLLAEATGSGVPTTAGHLLLSHWSNGNPGWSHGPPTVDAVTTVSYVKAYFNSSLAQRHQDFASRCKDPSASGAVCAIPDHNATFFFSAGDNLTPNQTEYGGAGNEGDEDNDNGASELVAKAWVFWLAFGIVIFASF